MPSRTNERLQGSKYDKILRENMRLAMPGIMKKVLGLNIVSTQELKDKIQITRQKEVDALRIVTDTAGTTYILHVEFESKNKHKMNFRMGEYRCMLHQIYDHPVKQYVIYMGNARLSTPSFINLPGLQFEYKLISILTLSYKLFLSSNEPEEQILSVLADFGNDDPTEVIQTVLKQLGKNNSGELTDNKYYEQLRVLLQMRNLDKQIDKAMDSVNTFFKKERDTLYKWGRKEERAKAQQEMRVKELQQKKAIARNLKNKGIDLNIIAEATGLSVEEIESL